MRIGGVDFLEDTQPQPSPNWSWAVDSARAVRFYRQPGLAGNDEIQAGAAALLGYARVEREVVGATPRVYISRQTPHAIVSASTNPVLTQFTDQLFCTSIPTGIPVGARNEHNLSTGLPDHKQGFRYRCEYRSLPWSVKEDDDVLADAGPLSAGTPATAVARPDEGDALRQGWASYSRCVAKRVEPGARAITFPNGFVKLVQVAPETKVQAVPAGLPVPFFRATIIYTWMNVPAAAVPDAAIAKCANAVNDAAFDGYAVETLFFDTLRLEPLLGPFGDRLFNIEYRFLYQPLPDFDGTTYTTKGWNHFPGVLSGKLRARELTMAQDGSAPADNTTRVFKRQDFASLFRPDQV